MAVKSKRRGPRPRPPEQKRTGRLSLKFLPKVLEQVSEAASLDKDEPAPWGRRVCEIAAEYRVVHGITIQEAYAAAMAARGLLRK
jgi:hypothetical protein